MSNLTCTIETVSGGIQKIKVIKPSLKVSKCIDNLIDYLAYCNGVEYILVSPPMNIHKEALKIKALYPNIEVEVINNRIKMCL